MSKSTPSSFNKDEILNFFEDDFPILVEVYKPFKSDYPNYLDQINTAFSEQNIDDLERGVHTLKGVFRNFFATELTDKLQDLETCVSNNDLTNFENKIGLCDKMAQSFFVEFDLFLSEYAEKNTAS